MPEELLVELVEQVDEIVAALTEQSPDEIEVTLFEAELGPEGPPGPVGPAGPQGSQGLPGPAGNPGITVSATAPSNPSINDLWLQIPA